MKVAVAGAGKVGRFLSEELAAAGHEVLLLEKNPTLVNSITEVKGVKCLLADACEVTTLHTVGVDQVDVMVAVTGDDEDNLVISLLAKQEFAVPRVIARVNHPKNHWLFNEAWGVDVAVSTPQLLAGLVEEAVSVGMLVRLLQFEGGHTRLVEVTLAEGSPAEGLSLSDVGLPRGSTVVALIRDGHVVVPRSDTILGVGDEVLILASAQIDDSEIQHTLSHATP